MATLKIILVDDNDSFRKALKNLLIQELDAEIISEASTGEEFKALQDYALADIILMDVMMPDIDGVSLAKQTLWKYPKLKILAITMHVDKVYLQSLIEAGFKGCVFKSNLFEQINEALSTVLNGKLYFPDNIILSSNK